MPESFAQRPILDPATPEPMTVVGYFDALVTSRVGLDGLLRATSALADTTVGALRRSRVVRYDADGHRLPANPPNSVSSDLTTHGVRLWLERPGPPQANDEILLSRLGIAVSLLEARISGEGGLDVVVDAHRTPEERREALTRLGIDTSSKIRLLASEVDHPAPGSPSTVVATKYGLLRATLNIGAEPGPTRPLGLGRWTTADQAPDSWQEAVVAYRLTDGVTTMLDATDIGVMVELARAHDPAAPHSDVVALNELDPGEHLVLRTLVEANSLRAAAKSLGMHHSTLQFRHESLTKRLGYDPRTPVGQMRFTAAGLLRSLTRGPGSA